MKVGRSEKLPTVATQTLFNAKTNLESLGTGAKTSAEELGTTNPHSCPRWMGGWSLEKSFVRHSFPRLGDSDGNTTKLLCAVWRVSVLWRKSPCCLCVFQEHPWWKHLWPRSPWRPQPGGLETGKQLHRQQKDPAISFFMHTCFLKCHLKTPETPVNYTY